MPAPEKAFLKQYAVLMRATGACDRYNNPVLEEPEEIRVRWLTKRSMSTDANGKPISLDATVIAKEVLPVDSQLWHGRLDDWLGTGTIGGDENIELMRVANFNETPDVKARVTRYSMGLQKVRNNTYSG